MSSFSCCCRFSIFSKPEEEEVEGKKIYISQLLIIKSKTNQNIKRREDKDKNIKTWEWRKLSITIIFGNI